MRTAHQQLEGFLKEKKALKSIEKYLEPYSLVWQHQEKKFRREDLLLDKHRQGTSPEFLNKPETQSFLLECCFLLSTIPKQRVFSAMQVKTIAAGFSDGQPLWKCLQRCKYPLGPIFWRLLPSDYQCFSASIATCSFLSAKYCLNSPAQHFAPFRAGKKDIWKCHWSDEGLILRKVIEKYNSKEQQALTWACTMWKFILSWFL